MESRCGGRAATNRSRIYPTSRHPLDEGVCDLHHGSLPPTQEQEEMTTIYSARWVLPVSSAPIEHGAVAIDGPLIAGVGTAAEIKSRFPDARVESFGESA